MSRVRKIEAGCFALVRGLETHPVRVERLIVVSGVTLCDCGIDGEYLRSQLKRIDKSEYESLLDRYDEIAMRDIDGCVPHDYAKRVAGE